MEQVKDRLPFGRIVRLWTTTLPVWQVGVGQLAHL